MESLLGAFLFHIQYLIILKMTNQEHIATLNPQKVALFILFISECEKAGWKVVITQSYRSLAYQAKLHKTNASNSKPGYSSHNYGFAIDINLYKGKIHLSKSSTKEEWIASGCIDIAKDCGLRWGAEFYDDVKKTGYYDPIHFDCVQPGYTAKWYEYLKKTYPDTYNEVEANKKTWKFYENAA